MESVTNLTNFDVNVFFVVPSKYKSEQECDKDMWDAYNKCPEWDVNPEWISESECLQMKSDKKHLFIMEAFEGEAFEKLQKFKCRIIGPRCLLSCFLTGDPIPEGSTPVFNTPMRNIIVCASGFSGSIKTEIQKKVEYMGGIFTKKFRASVTHLVTDIVMSAKYERAVELGIKIVIIDWIKSVWVTNLIYSTNATDPVFDQYKCPVFLNLVVTTTNLNKPKKEDIKKIINKHGGEFMSVLDRAKIKLLITETSSLSEKLKYAMQNNIPCLKVEWVYDSVKAGYSIPFANYLIKSTQACSTPHEERTEMFTETPTWTGSVKLSDIKQLSKLECLTVKQLKDLLSTNRVDYKGCVKRCELLDRASRLWEEYRTSRIVIETANEDVLCKICLDAPIECVILECGHMACCINCGKQMSKCPICRQYVVQVVRFFKA